MLGFLQIIGGSFSFSLADILPSLTRSLYSGTTVSSSDENTPALATRLRNEWGTVAGAAPSGRTEGDAQQFPAEAPYNREKRRRVPTDKARKKAMLVRI